MTRVAAASILACLAACGTPGIATQSLRYPDGRPQWEYEARDGVPHGRSRTWHANGTLKSQGSYVDGAKQGRFEFFNEDGDFAHQALFWKSVEVWRSTDRAAQPSEELLTGLATYSSMNPESAEEQSSSFSFRISKDPVPRSYFSSLDRTTGLDRVGLQLATSAVDDGRATRGDLFGNVAIARQWGVYGQLGQTMLAPAAGTALSGRRTLELGGTHRRTLGALGNLSGRLGVLFAISHDDMQGFLASSAGAYQRPTDAAVSVPSTVALRSGASVTREREHLVVQADAGVDWLVGGQATIDALVRANAAVGFGMRAGVISVELSNTMRVSDPALRVHALGLGGTFWFERMSLSGLFSLASAGTSALTFTVGYEL